MELTGKRVAILGDSIAYGKGASCPEKMFLHMLAERNGMTVVGNHSLCGTRIARQRVTYKNADWDRDFCARVDEMDPDVDVILIFGGVNDFGHGDAPLGLPTDKTEYTFCGALNVLYSKLITKYPHATIVVMTPLHRRGENNPCGDGFKEIPGGVLADYVDCILQVARRYSLPVCDLYATAGMLANFPDQSKYFFADGLHPNDNGNARILERLEGFLLAL